MGKKKVDYTVHCPESPSAALLHSTTNTRLWLRNGVFGVILLYNIVYVFLKKNQANQVQTTIKSKTQMSRLNKEAALPTSSVAIKFIKKRRSHVVPILEIFVVILDKFLENKKRSHSLTERRHI